ncbi:hypothetical protein CLAIMM_13886 [Cladophialophora immunda]|nr:hypothetical protein CLAIMM_13886 [Cladophialophora immunda]
MPEEDKIPMLGFAIENSDNVQKETTISVTTLLSLGATVDIIPLAFYLPLCINLPDHSPQQERTLDMVDGNKRCREKSTKIETPSIRARRVAKAAAATLVIDNLLSYMVQELGGRKKRPLTAAHFMSLELDVVDCTTFKREDELFGPGAPYTGSAHGSPLNNFLARKTGQPSMVFFDEFEKTTPDIHDALLIPFD